MKLSDMSQPELLEIADEFGTEATQDLNEQQIIARLIEDGVTQEMVSTFLQGKLAAEQTLVEAPVVEETTVVTSTQIKEGKAPRRKTTTETKVVEEVLPEQQLIFMDRENPTYRIRGYTFTRDHPFALVDHANAEYIVEHEEGFRYATPKEAREFYS